MKTIKIFVFAFFIFSAFSCSDDEDSVSLSEEEKMLLGSWKIESFQYTGTSTGEFEGIDLSSTYQGVGQDIDAFLTFKDNQTFSFEGNYDVLLSVTGFDGMLIPVDNASSSGDWYIQDNYLYTSEVIGQVDNDMVQSPEDSRMRIQEITENRLVLIIDQESEISQNGIDYLIELSGEYILTK